MATQAQKNSRPHIFVRLRLLPALMIVALILIGLKIENIYQVSKHIFVNQAQAEGAKEPVNPEATKKSKAAIKEIKADFPKKDEKKAGFKPETFNVLEMTPAKIEVLRMLSKRRRELDRREDTIAEREATLLAIEKRLDKKMDDLKGIQDYLETLLAQKNERDMETTKKLVLMYEKMKAPTAAEILQGIDLETLLNIMETMKEGKASDILARMEPLRARIVTMELAHRRKKQEEKVKEDFSEEAENAEKIEQALQSAAAKENVAQG